MFLQRPDLDIRLVGIADSRGAAVGQDGLGGMPLRPSKHLEGACPIFAGEPRSSLTVMEWDLTNTDGYIVDPGFYQVIVMTTASDVSYQVFVEEACRSFSPCACNNCAPCVFDSPCRPPFGELYLSLDVGEVRACNGLRFSITITFECEEEAP